MIAYETAKRQQGFSNVQTITLDQLPVTEELRADLVIIGGGAAGLTIARECIDSRFSVLVLESGGLHEEARNEALNKVERISELDDSARRVAVHQSYAPLWSHTTQPFGVRCRVLGGSTHRWAGKSAPLDEIDYQPRPWIPFSGWPVSQAVLQPYLDRAAEHLNLGPNVYDDEIWSVIGSRSPEPHLDSNLLKAFFWQFSRSPTDQFEAMRLGPELIRQEAANIRIILNATATEILTNDEGNALTGVRIRSSSGPSREVWASAAVLAASAIENPRLLLASRHARSTGIGNEHDVIGRFLMDHPATQLGTFDRAAAPAIMKRFGFQGLRHRGRMQMYMHGLTLAATVQRREELLNCALFMLEDFDEEDPVLALKRLVRRESSSAFSDLGIVFRSPLPALKGAAIKAFQDDRIPESWKSAVVNTIVRWHPNFAVREVLHRGVQYKLRGLRIEGITEQSPDPANRISLSDNMDAFGVPLARVRWLVEDRARRSLGRLAQAMTSELARVGLPVPKLADWAAEGRYEDAPVIDMAHMMGTTRMSPDPARGAVDINCRVHGVSGLYIAGASVFPTGGHANPTLMIVALAIRLADHLKEILQRQ